MRFRLSWNCNAEELMGGTQGCCSPGEADGSQSASEMTDFCDIIKLLNHKTLNVAPYWDYKLPPTSCTAPQTDRFNILFTYTTVILSWHYIKLKNLVHCVNLQLLIISSVWSHSWYKSGLTKVLEINIAEAYKSHKSVWAAVIIPSLHQAHCSFSHMECIINNSLL